MIELAIYSNTVVNKSKIDYLNDIFLSGLKKEYFDFSKLFTNKNLTKQYKNYDESDIYELIFLNKKFEFCKVYYIPLILDSNFNKECYYDRFNPNNSLKILDILATHNFIQFVECENNRYVYNEFDNKSLQVTIYPTNSNRFIKIELKDFLNICMDGFFDDFKFYKEIPNNLINDDIYNIKLRILEKFIKIYEYGILLKKTITQKNNILKKINNPIYCTDLLNRCFVEKLKF